MGAYIISKTMPMWSLVYSQYNVDLRCALSFADMRSADAVKPHDGGDLLRFGVIKPEPHTARDSARSIR